MDANDKGQITTGEPSDEDDQEDFSDDFDSDEWDDYSEPEIQGNAVDEHPCRGRALELVATEKDFIRNLEILVEVTASASQSRVASSLDYTTLLGNVTQVIEIAKKFLRDLHSVTQCTVEEMQVGRVFLQYTSEMCQVYKVYCSNYSVEVLPLLKKYEEDLESQNGLQWITQQLCRHNPHLLNLSSVLIKPVQRVFKYPLFLDELLRDTTADHPDLEKLKEAKTCFENAIHEINEYTRGVNLVYKYRLGTDDSLESKLRRVSIRSLVKKSSRVSTFLSQKLGITEQTMNLEFDNAEAKFRSIQKATEALLKHAASMMEAVRVRHTAELTISDGLVDLFPQTPGSTIVKQATLEFCNKYLQMFDSRIQERVLNPVRQMMVLCEGPSRLLQKRQMKMLDYDNAQSRLQDAKDTTKISSEEEELTRMRDTYEALNAQLMAELPVLIKHAEEVLAMAIHSLIAARLYLQGHLAKVYLQLAEIPGLTYIEPEEAKRRAQQQVDYLLTLLPQENLKKQTASDTQSSKSLDASAKKSTHAEGSSKLRSSVNYLKRNSFQYKLQSRRSAPSATPSVNQIEEVVVKQKPGRRSAPSEYFKSFSQGKGQSRKGTPTTSKSTAESKNVKDLLAKYTSDMIYEATEEFVSTAANEVTLQPGDVVGVLKMKDPLGNPMRWVVDNGENVGLVNASCLRHFRNSIREERESTNYSSGRYTDNTNKSSDQSQMQSNLLRFKQNFENTEKVLPHISYQSNPITSAACIRPGDMGRTEYHSLPMINHVSHQRELEVTETNNPVTNAEIRNVHYHSEEIRNVHHHSEGKETYDEIKSINQVGQMHTNNYLVDEKTILSRRPEQGAYNNQHQLTNNAEHVTMYVALYSFEAGDNSQLCLSEGEIVTGVSVNFQDWWYVENKSGHRGYVPALYLEEWTSASTNL